MARFNEAIHQTSLRLVMGKRLEFNYPGRPIMYAGSSEVRQRDPFWVEMAGGRIYYESAEEAAAYLQRHLGDKALLRAKVFES